MLSARTAVGLVTDLVSGRLEDREQVMDEGNLGLSGLSPPIINVQPFLNKRVSQREKCMRSRLHTIVAEQKKPQNLKRYVTLIASLRNVN